MICLLTGMPVGVLGLAAVDDVEKADYSAGCRGPAARARCGHRDDRRCRRVADDSVQG
jgi:hypothetical protein